LACITSLFFFPYSNIYQNEIRGGIYHCVSLHHINQMKGRSGRLLFVSAKRLPLPLVTQFNHIVKCHSINEKDLSQYVHISRYFPRQLFSLHNYFLAIDVRTICVYVHNSYARSSMPQLLEERERSNETTLNC
jgi:hypothetical protein